MLARHSSNNDTDNVNCASWKAARALCTNDISHAHLRADCGQSDRQTAARRADSARSPPPSTTRAHTPPHRHHLTTDRYIKVTLLVTLLLTCESTTPPLRPFFVTVLCYVTSETLLCASTSCRQQAGRHLPPLTHAMPMPHLRNILMYFPR